MPSRAGSLGAGRHLFAVPGGGADAPDPAPATTSPLAQVMELAARGASGELVCSSSGEEVHVFLQEGRIAWASSTRQRRAFTEHLKAITGVEDDVIDAVVADCTRTRRPIGEGLIAWKVATAEQVRASLLHQIRTTLASAAQATDARTLFLERARYRYDGALTFPLAEVISGAPAARRAGADVAPPPAAEPASDPAAELAAMPGFAAAAVLSGRGEPLAVVGDGARVQEVAGLTHQLLQEGQRLAIELGAGLCRQLHVEADEAHLLVYPARMLRVVLVLRDLSCLPLARHRIAAVAAGLAGAGAPP